VRVGASAAAFTPLNERSRRSTAEAFAPCGSFLCAACRASSSRSSSTSRSCVRQWRLHLVRGRGRGRIRGKIRVRVGVRARVRVRVIGL